MRNTTTIAETIWIFLINDLKLSQESLIFKVDFQEDQTSPLMSGHYFYICLNLFLKKQKFRVDMWTFIFNVVLV